MAQPQTVEEIFERIFQEAKETRLAYNLEYEDFVDREVDKLRRAHVFMAQVTGDDYFN